MQRYIILFFLFCSLILTSCTVRENTTGYEVQLEEKPETLSVYVNGNRTRSLEGEEYYFNFVSVGPSGPLACGVHEEGHILYDALHAFEEESGIELEITYFEFPEDMELQLKEDRENHTEPDVVLWDNRRWGGKVGTIDDENMFRLIADDWFYDLTDYMDSDGIYDSGEYYNEVLRAGRWKDRQYVVPFLFNMDALYSSKEDLQYMGCQLNPSMTAAELLGQLMNGLDQMQDGDVVLDSMTTLGGLHYICGMFWRSMAGGVVDYTQEAVNLDLDFFETYATFYRRLIEKDAPGAIKILQERKRAGEEIADVGLQADSSVMQDRCIVSIDPEEIKDWFRAGGIHMENAGDPLIYHSFIGQAMFLNSIYQDLGEEMVMSAVPQWENANAYTAWVHTTGAVMEGSRYPYAGYQLLHFLMDQEYEALYTISVNRGATQRMLDTLSETEYTLYVGAAFAWGDVDLDKVATYEIRPLPGELREQIEYILDHIGAMVLIEDSIQRIPREHLLAYVMGEETVEEAYEGTVRGIQENIRYLVGE